MYELLKSLIDWFVWLFKARGKRKKKSVTIDSKALRMVRGIVLALLVLGPLLIWLDSAFKNVDRLPPLTINGACPPADPIPISELIQHPERFEGRRIWIVGKLLRGHKKCILTYCFLDEKICCHPCYAFLHLASPYAQIKLDGHLKGQRLHCSGTTCNFHCNTLKLGHYYALFGHLRPSLPRKVPFPPSSPIRNKKHLLFYATDFCPLDQAPPNERTVRLPDPPPMKLRLQRFKK